MNEEIPPQVPQVAQGTQGTQVSIVEGGNDISVVPPKLSNSDIREALLALARAMTTNVKLSMVPRVNLVEITMKSRLTYFVNMNTLIFIVSKV